ncbi:Thiol-disulfide isomerase or thioredoxin [Pedobacter terrae]|uniref:Thiol-disulfide isomerase or thioredoxin n=1 Tax=Pedobacter terrae TaxID=405671 RepID=A0A1G8ENC5_9SPHI|nr:TlpA disulfide reductase family protein [Pedobacter terrae]SDH71368.1 Thiol-disulfide isomerase or thioredoxin [Pedobacter terrae]
MNPSTMAISGGRLCLHIYHSFLKILTVFLLFMALAANGVTAQGARPASGVAVGGAVPEAIWQSSHFVFSGGTPDEGKNTSVTLNRYRGKLILLDFWATYCVPCIANFPKMKMLQQKYRNDLQIILVNNEPVARASSFLQKRKNEHNEAFTAIVADTLLNNTFPHRTIPHYVWIGKGGKVLAITGEEELEEAKLLQAMAGGGSSFVNKKNIDPALPLFSSADFPTEALQKYSLLTKGRVSGLASGTQFRKAKSGLLVGRAFTNTNFFSLYSTIGRVLQRAAGQRFSDQQIRYTGADSAGFLHDSYNYEFVVPERLSARLYPMMLADLNTYSPYVGTLKTQKTDCLVLERYRTARTAMNNGGGSILDQGAGQQGALNLKNVPVGALVDHLENLAWNRLPVINKTGISQRLSISIPLTGNLQEVNAGLRQYGLRLRPAKKKVTIMLISDQPNETLNH